MVNFPGVLGIGRLAMQANSVIDHSDHFNFECSNIHMRFSSTITANRITVDAATVHLEGEASFEVSGKLFSLSCIAIFYTAFFVICVELQTHQDPRPLSAEVFFTVVSVLVLCQPVSFVLTGWFSCRCYLVGLYDLSLSKWFLDTVRYKFITVFRLRTFSVTNIWDLT